MVLQRYLLKELFVPFLFSFSVIMFLLVVDLILQLADLLLGKGVSIRVVGELFFLHTAWMVALAVPMAVLVGTLMAFGRLSGDNEITAMRSIGIGFHQMLWPALAASAVVAVLLILFNDRVLPEFNHRARLLTMDIHRKRPAAALDNRVGVFIEDFRNYHILIGGIDGKTGGLEDVLIYKYEPSGYPVTISARRGQVRYDLGRDEAYLVLEEGEINQLDPARPELYVSSRFGRQTLRLGEAGRTLARTESSYRNDREMGIDAMQSRMAEYQAEADSLRASSSRRWQNFLERSLFTGAFGPDHGAMPPSAAAEPGGFDDLMFVATRAGADATLIAHKQRQVDRLGVEIHKKYSIPVACLAFVLVGAPLGMRMRRGGAAVGAGISIGFFLIYWLFLIAGEKLADRGLVAPWLAMWSPNLLLFAAGLVLVLRPMLRRRGREESR